MLRYNVLLERPSSHLFSIEIGLETGGSEYIDLEFPAWSPGRYFIYDFARNVQELRAVGGNGAALPVRKIAKGRWRIAANGATEATISYKMFGDTLSGTFSQLDDRHASINGSSLFGYIVGREMEPIELEIIAPEGWKSYAALKRKRRSGRMVYHVENYDLLIDSPIEIGTPLTRSFSIDGVTYHMIIDIAGAEGTRRSREIAERIDRYVGDTEKIVRAYTSTFGRPEFDDYYFLVNIDPYAPNGDGMEHLASTRLVINGYITNEDRYNDLLDVTSHEFFHIWNVKRLRPAELGPFDYTRELHTTLLWFAEGFTQYYGHLMVRRAGVWDDKQFLKEMVGEINMVDRSPGRFHRNLRDSSFDTWHAVGARSPIGATTNYKNTYVNYYYKGAVAALLLDLEIRRRTGNRRSLDDVIRELYRSSYAEAELDAYFLRGRGYSEEDIYAAVEKIAGKEVGRFLRHLVESVEEIDYTKYLKHVGLDLTRLPRKEGNQRGGSAGKPQLFLGLIIPEAKDRSAEFVSVMNVLADSPADRAGFSAGDLIVAIDGERVDGKRWDTLIGTKRPGDLLQVTFFRGSRLLTLPLRVEERDLRPFRLEPMEHATPAQKRARGKWMGKKMMNDK